MAKFATAYISFSDNEMKMAIVEAESEQEALLLILQEEDWELDKEDHEKTAEELKVFAFDCDSMIGAIQLP